jgi:hypothetical protein
VEYKKKIGAFVCLNCGDDNLSGPFKHYDANLQVDWKTHVKQVALVCNDCGYTMYFTEENERKKISKEEQ